MTEQNLPAPEPKRKKSIFARWWFWVLVAIALIVVLVAVSGGGDDTASPSSNGTTGATSASAPATQSAQAAAPKSPAAPAAAPLGTTAKAADFEITVTQVEKGVPQVGDVVGGTLLGEKAQGQFVLVHVTVKNVSNDPSYFMDSDLPMYDDQNRKFSADDSASLYIDNNSTLFNEINPGNTLQGVVVYDIPTDASPTHLEYTGSLFGSGTQFALN
jgi:hypothetical protein